MMSMYGWFESSKTRPLIIKLVFSRQRATSSKPERHDKLAPSSLAASNLSSVLMKKLLLFVLAFSFHLTALGTESFSTLEERMTGKDFSKTGLGKLTDGELAALNNWLKLHSVATPENVTKETPDPENQVEEKQTGKIIRSIVLGDFEGWDKNTLFKLANGQLWKQAEYQVYYADPTAEVEVEIKQAMMGKWYLSVVGQSREVRVERIQ
jgi:hypothetical protein